MCGLGFDVFEGRLSRSPRVPRFETKDIIALSPISLTVAVIAVDVVVVGLSPQSARGRAREGACDGRTNGRTDGRLLSYRSAVKPGGHGGQVYVSAPLLHLVFPSLAHITHFFLSFFLSFFFSSLFSPFISSCWPTGMHPVKRFLSLSLSLSIFFFLFFFPVPLLSDLVYLTRVNTPLPLRTLSLSLSLSLRIYFQLWARRVK